MRVQRRWLLYCLVGMASGCGGAQGPQNAGEMPPNAVQAAQADEAPPPAKAVDHKIIHTADLHVAVADLTAAARQLVQLVDSAKGYVATSNVYGTVRNGRSGTWKIRVPVERYDRFLADVEQLGSVQSSSTDSQDVTAEFYDLEARIRNKQQEESRLLKHLDQSTGQLDEILSVERELSRVREEIERMQGRRNVLQDLTALTTVTVRLTEDRNTSPQVATTLGGRLTRTFFQSVDALRWVATERLVVIVAIAPWVLLLVVVVTAVLRTKRLLLPSRTRLKT